MLNLGEINTLRVLRDTPPGMFLGDEDDGEVLLPNKYVPEDLQVGQFIDVFLYTDSEDRIVATTLTPKFFLYEFAVLEVMDVTNMGYFLGWGLDKDLLLPFSEHRGQLDEGDEVTVCLCYDEEMDRLFASSYLSDWVEPELTVKEGEEVDLLVDRQSEIGWQVVINNRHLGLVFLNKVFQPLRKGDQIKGFIDNIREDGKIDVSLQKRGYSQVEDSQALVLKKLQDSNGVLHLTDKSDANLISNEFGMSKSVFKKCVGALYKQRKIKIEADRIVLLAEKV